MYVWIDSISESEICAEFELDSEVTDSVLVIVVAELDSVDDSVELLVFESATELFSFWEYFSSIFWDLKSLCVNNVIAKISLLLETFISAPLGIVIFLIYPNFREIESIWFPLW